MNCSVCNKSVDGHHQGSTEQKALKRFLSKIPQNLSGKDCWQWQGDINKSDRYGRFYFKGRTRLAHRVSVCLLLNIPVPKDKMVMHLCHNRQCINPHHLKLGTAKENSDMDVERNYAGNIFKNGKAHPTAKLTEKDVKWVHTLKDKYSKKEIAKAFGVTRQCIGDVLRGRNWSHVKQ